MAKEARLTVVRVGHRRVACSAESRISRCVRHIDWPRRCHLMALGLLLVTDGAAIAPEPAEGQVAPIAVPIEW